MAMLNYNLKDAPGLQLGKIRYFLCSHQRFFLLYLFRKKLTWLRCRIYLAVGRPHCSTLAASTLNLGSYHRYVRYWNPIHEPHNVVCLFGRAKHKFSTVKLTRIESGSFGTHTNEKRRKKTTETLVSNCFYISLILSLRATTRYVNFVFIPFTEPVQSMHKRTLLNIVSTCIVLLKL